MPRPQSIASRRLTRRHALQGALAAGGLVLVGCSTAPIGQSNVDDSLLASPGEDRWPDLFYKAPASVQGLYRYAAANQDDLKWLPCFCGCVDEGHTSNFDCFFKQVRGDGSIVLDTMSFT